MAIQRWVWFMTGQKTLLSYWAGSEVGEVGWLVTPKERRGMEHGSLMGMQALPDPCWCPGETCAQNLPRGSKVLGPVCCWPTQAPSLVNLRSEHFSPTQAGPWVGFSHWPSPSAVHSCAQRQWRKGKKKILGSVPNGQQKAGSSGP